MDKGEELAEVILRDGPDEARGVIVEAIGRGGWWDVREVLRGAGGVDEAVALLVAQDHANTCAVGVA